MRSHCFQVYSVFFRRQSGESSEWIVMCLTKWCNESPLKLVEKRFSFQTDKPELHLACLGKNPFKNLGYEKRS